MKNKPLLIHLLILAGLIALAFGAYALARLLPTPILPAWPNQPPLTRLHLPIQTHNDHIATVESYYVDALHLIFQVRVVGGEGIIGNLNLYDEYGNFVNSSVGWGSASENDLSLNQIKFDTVTPLPGQYFKGQLVFSVVPSPGDMETLADFKFDIDIPAHSA